LEGISWSKIPCAFFIFLRKIFFLDEFTGMMGIGLGYNDDYDEHAMTCA